MGYCCFWMQVFYPGGDAGGGDGEDGQGQTHK